ncbi:MAG: hypothetical protein P4L68_08500 [Methylovirgula sp.]|nr:hypothetical protein [Methylovirgula sp.]
MIQLLLKPLSALSDRPESAIDKKSRKTKKLEQILIEKVYQLFPNLLRLAIRPAFGAKHASNAKAAKRLFASRSRQR